MTNSLHLSSIVFFINKKPYFPDNALQPLHRRRFTILFTKR